MLTVPKFQVAVRRFRCARKKCGRTARFSRPTGRPRSYWTRCVPEAHAIRILQAIEKQNLVNAQPTHPLTGVVPSVPTVRLSQVHWIGARGPTGRRVDGSEAGPFELYDVRTVSLESGLWGLSLRVSVRDDYVELRSVGAWLE